jgi:23S rRNA (uracil-5-)-methyltransferase RumA
MNLKKGQIIELKIDSLAFGAAGIGRFEELVVFVKNTVPGDLVKASFTKIKPNYAEAELVEIIEKSDKRVNPPCKFEKTCGGCQIQYLPYDEQVKLKKQHVIDCLERIGNFRDDNKIKVLDPLAAKDQFHYRNKMEFSFGYDQEMNFALGMHIPKRRYDILDIDDCLLTPKKLQKLVNIVREFVLAQNSDDFKPFQYSCGQGSLRSLFIREGKNSGEIMVNLATSHLVSDQFEETLKPLVEKLTQNGATSIYWTKVISKRGQKRQDISKLLAGQKHLTEFLTVQNQTLEFKILPSAFFQVNTTQAEVLYEKVLDYAKDLKAEVIFDLFCGTGTIGMFLAKEAKKVIGVELNEKSVKAAEENAALNNIDNVEFICGDAAKIAENLEKKPDLIVVDPPRAGLGEKLIEIVVQYDCKHLIYVSCNPATMARDLKILKESGYKVKECQPVDMFPNTYHIENICFLSK